MIVLGGLGSLAGAILGAFIFTALPEVLRNVELAGFLFYAGLLIGLGWWLRPWWRFVGVVGGTIAGALLLKLLVNLFWPWLDTGQAPAAGSFLNSWVQSLLVIPPNVWLVGNIAVGLTIVTTLLTVSLKNGWRWVMLSLTLYLLAFAWETRLATEPAATRILVVGIVLVVLMITRPQGLLGKPRVEIV
jgi:ABC-type branched-subunit amino acid transport system permease subunit